MVLLATEEEDRWIKIHFWKLKLLCGGERAMPIDYWGLFLYVFSWASQSLSSLLRPLSFSLCCHCLSFELEHWDAWLNLCPMHNYSFSSGRLQKERTTTSVSYILKRPIQNGMSWGSWQWIQELHRHGRIPLYFSRKSEVNLISRIVKLTSSQLRLMHRCCQCQQQAQRMCDNSTKW
jgi:hypothetical protein